ncbi:MAG: ATP-binding protein [Planctomycetota bacterium]|jgi:signal transduction histidine kinase
MVRSKLIISSQKGEREILLDPKGVTLGRDPNCDIKLDDKGVSRNHARIYQDTFGRWIIEDLGSHNGVLINGQRIEAQALLPAQKINISHFTLSFSEGSDLQTAQGISAKTTIPVVDKGLGENIVSYRTDRAAVLSPDLMQHLNELTSNLLKLSSPSQLYSQVCLSLAEMLDTPVAIIRLPQPPDLLPKQPEILACNFGMDVLNKPQISNLHLSKRVLDAVRMKDVPVMASSGPSPEKHLALTIVDEISPHIVFAARVNDSSETVDTLYMDILQDKSTKEMFDFIEAVARQINFVQKHLFFTELQKQEKALREANIQLKEKDRIKDEYVARVTHDIKGHLAAIQSCLHVGTDPSSGSLSEKQADFLTRAQRRTTQVTDFVIELLHLTQMRLSGEFQIAPFSLPHCIEEAVKTVERKAQDKLIDLTFNVEKTLGQINGNQFSINELFTNLLFNAIKYTPDGKTVHVEAKDLGDDVQIDIIDTGIGIPVDEVQNVFNEFYRASNVKESNKEGTGLGLSIVQQIVQRHSGKISVESQLGKGTTFTVVLPKGSPTFS